MPINSNKANSDQDVRSFSRAVEDSIEQINNLSIESSLGGIGTYLDDRLALLKNTVDNVDHPIIKGLATDMIAVMSNWFHDPQVLCCLIQGIWTMYAVDAFNGRLLSNNKFSLADSDFGKFIDTLVSFIDLLIVLLTQDIRKFVFFIPDFIKEITSGLLGAILLVLQETIFALRNSLLNSVLRWIDSGVDTDNIWAKCLPFKQMIDIIKKYVHDYGMLADIMAKIRGWVSGLKLKWGEFGLSKVIPNINDLEYLYWLRDLLLKLKFALINFDLCVDYSYYSPDGTEIKPTGEKVVSVIPNRDRPGFLKVANPDADRPYDGYTIQPDGTLTVDTNKVKTIPLLANSFVREFIHENYPEIPLESVDNIITGSDSTDHIQGTNINTPGNISDLNADCPFTPNKEDFLRWVARIRS